jgi:hypothetical protein
MERHRRVESFDVTDITQFAFFHRQGRKERQAEGKRQVRNLAAWRLGGSPRKVMM